MARQRLSKMRITRVSLVDRPAGIGAEVVLAKRDDEDESHMQNTSEFTGRGNMSQVIVGATEGANMGSTDGVKKSDNDADDMSGGEATRTRRKKVAKSEAEVLEDVLKSLPPEAISYIERLEDIIIDMKGDDVEKADDDEDDDDTDATDEVEGDEDDEVEDEADDTEDEDDAVAEADDEDDEPAEDESDADEDVAEEADAEAGEPALAKSLSAVLKGADPKAAKIIQGYIAKADQKAARAEKIAKRERDLRLHREYVAKAADLSALPAKQDDLVNILKTVGDKAPEIEEMLTGILKAAHGALKESDIFKAEGRDDAADNSTAIAKFDSAVAEIRKSDPNLTAEQAFTKALDLHPELYDDYLNTNNSSKGR